MKMKTFTTFILVSIFGILLPVTVLAQADAFVTTNSWAFHNFSLPKPDWNTYRNTYIDIPATEDPTSSAFDVLFFNEAYSQIDAIGGGGFCYGMSLMSLLMIQNGGNMGFCIPIPQYSGDLNCNTDNGPSNTNLINAIAIMHGHQMNLPTVQFIANIFAQHENRDGNYAFNQFQYWQSRENYTLVSITPSLSPTSGGGHTVLGYRAVDNGGGNKQIFVIDPNRSWEDPNWQSWYQNHQNFVQINGQSWSYTMASCPAPDPETPAWQGSPNSGGNLIITPASITGPESPSPVSLGTQIIGQLLTTLLLTGDAASIQQITDDHGRRLFKPGTSELETDPKVGMPNMMPLFTTEQISPTNPPVLAFIHFGSTGGALHVTVKCGPGGYHLRSYSSRTVVSVTAHGGDGAETLDLRFPTTSEAGVTLNNHRGTTGYDIQLFRNEIPRQQMNIFSVSNVTASAQGPFEIALENQGHALSINAHRVSSRYDLQIQTVTRSARDIASKSQVTQDAGTTHTFQPKSWHDLKSGGILERVQSY
jgi:hypothetical protein